MFIIGFLCGIVFLFVMMWAFALCDLETFEDNLEIRGYDDSTN